MSPLTIFALIVFIVTYILIFSLQRFRPFVSVAAAIVFVVVGSAGVFSGFSYTLIDALKAIDWNVIMMIIGTMGTVYLFIRSGMPQLLSDIIVSKIHSVRLLIVILSLFAGIISAFVDNVATVLMIAPVALAICQKLNISPVPAIICISVSSNLQGAATLVGDTTSILLAKAANLDFADFFVVQGKPGMFWVTEVGAIAATLIIFILFKKENAHIEIHDRSKVEDKVPTALLLLTIVSLIAVSFIPYKMNAAPGQFYKPEITNGLICLAFFAIGLIRQIIKEKSALALKNAFLQIDFFTVFLLLGLFVVIGGISEAGIIDLIGNGLAGMRAGDGRMAVFLVYSVIVWMSVILSAFIDNIPYIATMLPVVTVIAARLSASSGLDINPNLFYFGLLVGATLGGNLTPVGASANITGIGILRRNGYEVKTGTFMKYGVPVTLAAVFCGYLLVWAIWS